MASQTECHMDMLQITSDTFHILSVREDFFFFANNHKMQVGVYVNTRVYDEFIKAIKAETVLVL